ncbi:type IV toxin-antitoxin system AbiEi family antitoxin [uncultured Williamsia sp.]|uniref:type IV toxin-antitoxin system AbiEi family antitoxin n=1 Tax=uncultured Williamsia sp. TaxID=259311 RepID=UPI002616AF1B|nr:type IV toxin-antitoxin system AbiEi family antitoxin [uncultured Williamsia sp.]
MSIDNRPFALGDHSLPGHIRPRDIRRDFRMVHRGVYAEAAVPLSPVETIRAAWLRAGPDSVVGGISAAVLHGATFFDHGATVELIRPPTGQARRFNDVRVHRTELNPADVVVVDGMPVTSPIRTAFDLGRRSPAWIALAHLDDLTRATDLDHMELWRFVVAHPAVRNIRQLRGLVPWIDAGAESSGESWTRHLILADGLPRPETQVKVYDEHGTIIAKFDLAYRREKIGVEFDGFEYHYSDDQRLSNATRDRQTSGLGWHTERRNSVQLSGDPIGFLSCLRGLLDSRGRRRGR